MLNFAILLCAGAAAAEVINAQDPMITPSPSLSTPSRTLDLKRRDILSDVAGDISTLLSGLGSGIPSYVASGIPNFFQNFPQGQDVQSSLGLDNSQVSALPTQVLNLPPYANWTTEGWMIRFRANIYKEPNISQSKVDDLTNVFLVDTSVDKLPPDQATQARNVTRSIFVIGVQNANVTFSLAPAPTEGADGGATQPSGGAQTVRFPEPTTDEGDIDGFVPINSSGLQPGNQTSSIQRLNVWANGTTSGNATAYLVPETGLTVVSDIDDILRVTRIYDPADGLLNSFARPYTPWMNMPDIYANWSRSFVDLHFHYLTTLPEQVTRTYEEYIFRTYPLGSFDTRPLNFSDISATLSVRQYLLRRLFQTFPARRFCLIGDVSNSDIMRGYPALVSEFPGQVQCIFLRNTTSTDSGDRFPYDTSGFKGLNQSMYMFFNVPDDLTHLDIAGGQCYNKSIKQNLTFGYQNLPGGLSTGNGKSAAPSVLENSFSGRVGWLLLAFSLLIAL